jgi:DNA-binding CsgD family transcriptional regulator
MGGVPGEPRDTLQQLREKHHKIKRMLFMGKSPAEISKTLGVTVQTISNVRNSKLMRLALSRMHVETDKEVVEIESRINKLLAPSLEKLEEVIRDGTLDGDLVDKSDRLKVIEHALGRGGYPSNPKVEGNRGTSSVTKTTIERVKARALQLAEGSGQMIEMEGVTINEGGQ